MKQSLQRFIILFGCAALFVLCGCRTLPAADFSPQGEHLKAVTYNINVGGNAARVAEFLGAADAEIVCLQETHAEWEAYLRRQLGKQYPHMVFHHDRGAGGIAIMSKYRLREPQIVRSESGWFGALYAWTATPLGDIGVLNVHLKPPLSERGSATPSTLYDAPKVHLDEIGTFLDAVDKTRPLLIAGDFNEDESGSACKRLSELGYVDALSLYDRKSPTWRWPVGWGITLKERYDHIFIDPAFTCTGAAVFKVRASDHEPVLAAITKIRETH